MKRRIIILIAIIAIPLLILVGDRLIFYSQYQKQYTRDQEWEEILDHKSDYPKELLELACRHLETLDFVKRYPQDHLKNPSMDLSQDLNKNEIPLLLQWDSRWGYKKYGDEFMAISGCGPTCLSMVASYLCQNPQYHPYFIAQFAYQNGYYSKQGTSWQLMSKGAEKLGLISQELSLNENIIKHELQNSHPIICSVREGTFTSTGHFIVLTDYKNGKIHVNDPNSRKKSQFYTYDELAPQIKNLWSYQVA